MNVRVLSALAAGSLVSAGLVGLGVVIAGPLNPPAGPVTSTYKTLTEVEPRTAVSAANTPGDVDSLYRIDQPGSYYLTGNITGVSGKSGIKIAANDVTLDLRGFSVTGVAGALSGIVGASAHAVVSNGALTLWPQAGVSLTGNGNQVRDLDARGCGGHGIQVGAWAQVERCRTLNNGGAGIRFETIGTAIDCVASVNGAGGIDGVVGYRHVYTRCLAEQNTTFGMRTGLASRLCDCTASFNSTNGFSVEGATLERCTAAVNAVGFACGDLSSLNGCVAYGNSGGGYTLANTCSASGCTAENNSVVQFTTGGACELSRCTALQSGAVIGYQLGAGSNASDCSSQGGDTGFVTGAGCTVTRCSARLATNYGFNAGNQSTLTWCEASGNTAGGFIVAATGVRVEANHVAGGSTGFMVTGTANLIIRNSATGTGAPYNIAAGNSFGPTVVAAGMPASNNPHANYAP